MRSLTFLLCLLSFTALAQVPEPAMLWLNVTGGNSTDLVQSFVSKTQDGGFIFSYESGSTTGPIDTICNMPYVRTIFRKYNSDASAIEWTKCYLNNFSDSAFIYAFSTPDGGYILGGDGNGFTNKFLIHKEDAIGTILWSKSYGDSSEAILESMVATNDGGYIMLGKILYISNDFPTHYGTYGTDIGVLRVDSNGDKMWSKVIGGSEVELASSVILAPNNGCYIIGSTVSNDHDCTGNHGLGDAYIAKLDSNGNILWHNDLGGTGDDGGGGTNAFPDGKGGVIIATISGSNDGDVSHQINVGGYNMWAIDIDSGNHILWNNCYGGGGYELPYSVCKATDGSIWLAGLSQYKAGEVDTAYGGGDAWFVHADSIGNFLSAKVMGSTGQDQGYMIYPLSNGNVIAGGYYEFGNGIFNISWGGVDAFLTVFAPENQTIVKQIENTEKNIKIYPNPADGKITIETNYMKKNTLIITDVVGALIFQLKNQEKYNINVSGWLKGMYYVQVVNENGFKITEKLLVE